MRQSFCHKMIPKTIEQQKKNTQRTCIIIHWNRKCRAFYNLVTVSMRTTKRNTELELMEKRESHLAEFEYSLDQWHTLYLKLIRLQSLNIFTQLDMGEWLTCWIQSSQRREEKKVWKVVAKEWDVKLVVCVWYLLWCDVKFKKWFSQKHKWLL